MGDDPTSSVVDSSGRCHELENLYVADASVFPSCPAVGPGLTVIALALRLGDHLAGATS
jgi:choline dehydrogenase-like flavoprotein